jgi:GT2 family glycosyltransferase
MPATPNPSPLVSVIITTYNDGDWLPRCLESLKRQSIFNKIEVIIADNASTDGTTATAQNLLADWSNGRFLQNDGNIGFGSGNNRGAAIAQGKYLYFINSDTWFEPDCIEKLYQAAEQNSVAAASATILEYADDTLIASGSDGFDCFGNPVSPSAGRQPKPIFCIAGFYFIRKEVFDRIGSFDEAYFMYGEELDISWRLWICGEKIVPAFDAKVHHRGAVGVNPDGGIKPTENRTSQTKRFYANRNHLLTIAKNANGLLLILLFPAFLLIFLEGLMTLLITRKLVLFKITCVSPTLAFWKLLPHVKNQRQKLSNMRRHGDFWLLQFFRFRFGRSHEVRQILGKGFPKIS